MDKYIYKAKLVRVVDGDTVDALIDVGFDIWFKKRIRFKGIDTWESRTRNLEEKALGLKAKARTKELLESVSSKSGYFRLKSYGTGKYGRVLGELFVMDKEGKQCPPKPKSPSGPGTFKCEVPIRSSLTAYSTTLS